MNEKNPEFNLGRKEKRKRLFLGILSFLLGAALGIYFVFHEIPLIFRLLVWPLFFIAMLCFLQAKARTCVLFAWKRVQCLDSEIVPVTDRQANKALILKSQKILLQAFVLSLALTLACLFS